MKNNNEIKEFVQEINSNDFKKIFDDMIDILDSDIYIIHNNTYTLECDIYSETTKIIKFLVNMYKIDTIHIYVDDYYNCYDQLDKDYRDLFIKFDNLPIIYNFTKKIESIARAILSEKKYRENQEKIINYNKKEYTNTLFFMYTIQKNYKDFNAL